jgi:hypothetical protein
MTVPTVSSVSPSVAASLGGELVRIIGAGFGASIAVRFDDTRAEVVGVRTESGLSVADVRAPEHDDGFVDISLQNLDDGGNPVPGEEVFLAGAFRFIRPRLASESNLTRLVRTVRRKLSRHVLENTSIGVSLDYQEELEGDVRAVYMAELPAIVLSGPTLRPSLTYRSNLTAEVVVEGVSGPEVIRRSPSLTHDVEFSLTAASRSTAELLNLEAAVAGFFSGPSSVSVLRDPDAPEGERVSWELKMEGDFRATFDDASGTRAFQMTFVVEGFDTDEGVATSMTHEADDIAVETAAMAVAERVEGSCP